MSKIYKLPDVTFRVDESKILSHKLKINGVTEDMTSWTVQLYVGGSLLKTITIASSQATQGRIKDQSTSPGQYYFTILASDLASLLQSAVEKSSDAYVKFTTTDTSPPRVFSNVEFKFLVKK